MESINPEAHFQQISICVPKDRSGEVEAFLLAAGAIGYYEILYQEGISNLTADDTRMIFFFNQDFPAKAVVTLSLSLLGLGEVAVEQQLIQYADYIKIFEDSFKAFALTETFWLVPPWDRENPIIPTPARRLYLKPGLAFGTGRHPTSRMMISFLEQTVAPGARVFDLGSGSGILAIAAALLGAGQVQGVDVERLAVDSATDNFLLNQEQCSPNTKVKFFQGDFSFHTDPRCLQAIDVFVANILPNVFYMNKEDLFFYLRLSQHWALSGIPSNQGDEFSQFLTKGGFAFEIAGLEDWLIFYY